jgi:hypothetical protein
MSSSRFPLSSGGLIPSEWASLWVPRFEDGTKRVLSSLESCETSEMVREWCFGRVIGEVGGEMREDRRLCPGLAGEIGEWSVEDAVLENGPMGDFLRLSSPAELSS